MAIVDVDHSIAKNIARKANEIYGTDYVVNWAYIDVRRNFVYNGSEYLARIRNGIVYFDRTPSDTIKIDFTELSNDE